MRQEPIIESSNYQSFYLNTDERQNLSQMEMQKSAHSSSVYHKNIFNNLHEPMACYQSEIKPSNNRMHFPSTQDFEEHGFDQSFLNSSYETKIVTEQRLFPELKKRKIRQEMFKLHNYSATQDMLDRQRYLQVQLEKQQELIQEMKNQLHGVSEVTQKSTQRTRGANSNIKSVEPSVELRSPIKV